MQDLRRKQNTNYIAHIITSHTRRTPPQSNPISRVGHLVPAFLTIKQLLFRHCENENAKMLDEGIWLLVF